MANKTASASVKPKVSPATKKGRVVQKRTTTANAKPKTAVKSTARVAPKAVAKTTTKPVAKSIAKTVTRTKKAASASTSKPKKPTPAKVDKSAKPKKNKLIRDSFTMPESEYSLFAAIKKRCITKGVAVKKSEVLRAAIVGFAAQSDAVVLAALKKLVVIKTGRKPKRSK